MKSGQCWFKICILITKHPKLKVGLFSNTKAHLLEPKLLVESLLLDNRSSCGVKLFVAPNICWDMDCGGCHTSLHTKYKCENKTLRKRRWWFAWDLVTVHLLMQEHWLTLEHWLSQKHLLMLEHWTLADAGTLVVTGTFAYAGTLSKSGTLAQSKLSGGWTLPEYGTLADNGIWLVLNDWLSAESGTLTGWCWNTGWH